MNNKTTRERLINIIDKTVEKNQTLGAAQIADAIIEEKLCNGVSDSFAQGFAAACAITLRNHGCDSIVEDTYACNFMTVSELRNSGVDDYDIEILRPIIKEIDRKQNITNEL